MPVESHHFIMLGLALDIIGAFLVAVEAIKLKNLRALREKFFEPTYRHTLSPRIRFVDSERVVTPAQETESRPSEHYPPGLFQGLHFVAGFLVVAFVNHLLGGRLVAWVTRAAVWTVDRPLYITVPVVILAMVFGVVYGVGGLWMLGELVHMLITGATKLPIRLLELVEARTPDGTVGILGFFFLLVGFGLQFYGVYLGGGSR